LLVWLFHITNELHIYLATQAPRTEKHAATAADASHSEPTRLNKKLILTASHFCKPSVSICVCHMVYFASSQHIDEQGCIAPYFTFMRVLQNLYGPSVSSSSRDNKQFIFAQIYKQ